MSSRPALPITKSIARKYDFMNWTKLDFGRYERKTLPQILLHDPDWFFWAFESGAFKGRLAVEATDLNKKARRIKVLALPAGFIVQYHSAKIYRRCCPKTKLRSVMVVPKTADIWGAHRSKCIDLSIAREIAPYDKAGGKIIVRAVKSYCLGGRQRRMTARTCDECFSDDSNFDLPKKKPDADPKQKEIFRKRAPNGL